MNITLPQHRIATTQNNYLSWMNPYRNLEARISLIASSAFAGSITEQQTADLKQAFKLAHRWTWPAGRMQKLLSTLSNEVIQSFMSKLMVEGKEKDIDYYFDCCLDFLSENSLLNLSGFGTSERAIASFRSQGHTKSTALRNTLQKEGQAIWKEFLVELKYFAHNFMKILIKLSGLNEVTRAKHQRFGEGSSEMGMWEAKNKVEAYWQLLAIPAVIFGVIYSYIGQWHSAVLFTGVTLIAGLAGIVAYSRYWKPCPIDYSGLKNLSIELLKEKTPIYPRRDILKKIEGAFQAKKGVILVGAPGCGKSWIVRSLVEQAVAGKICSFIKDPQVFSCNGSFIKSNSEGVTLNSLEETFKGHKNQVVFFFDEFHSLFKKGGGLIGNSTADEIKTFCEDFKYVIGATTTQEYEKYIMNTPAIVDRRFKVIKVGPMTSDQIKIALSQYLEGVNSKIAFDPSVIDYIIEKAETFNAETAKIDAAQSLVNCAIEKMISTVHDKLEERVVTLEDELGLLEQNLIHGAFGADLDSLTEQLIAKKAQIVIAKQMLEKKNLQTQKMQNMEAYHLQLKRKSYQLADPEISLVKGSALARKWTMLHARIGIVKEFIRTERDRLGLPRCLDQSLIDKILSERVKENLAQKRTTPLPKRPRRSMSAGAI